MTILTLTLFKGSYRAQTIFFQKQGIYKIDHIIYPYTRSQSYYHNKYDDKIKLFLLKKNISNINDDKQILESFSTR